MNIPTVSLEYFKWDKENNTLTVTETDLNHLKVDFLYTERLIVKSHVTGEERTFVYDSQATIHWPEPGWVYRQESPERPAYELRIDASHRMKK